MLNANKVDTGWKFHDFSITQILREINFWDSRSAKSAILTHSEAQKCNFDEFLHFMKAEIYKMNHFQSPLKLLKLQF